MAKVKSLVRLLVVVIVLVTIGIFVVRNWSWVFAKKVNGEVINVERVTNPTTIVGSQVTSSQMHSYSILIKGDDGKFYTASSEDRQWQVVGKGYCVTTLLFRYPPWDLDKANTYFNARVEEIRECPSGSPQAKPADANSDAAGANQTK